EKSIFIEPDIFINNEITVCNQDSLILKIPDNYRCITWSNLSSKEDSIVRNDGNYIASAYNQKGCYVSDTVTVLFSNIGQPNIHRISDSIFTDSAAKKYSWYKDNSVFDTSGITSIKITDFGIYDLETENEFGCKSRSQLLNVSCP